MTYATQASYLQSIETQVQADIMAAYTKFHEGEGAFARDYGLAYGKVIFLARKKLADAGYGQLSQMLDNLNIPRSTAYRWMEQCQLPNLKGWACKSNPSPRFA